MTQDSESTPRWVKVAGVIAVVLVLLILVMLLVSGHGPSRHTRGAQATDGHAGPPPGVRHL